MRILQGARALALAASLSVSLAVPPAVAQTSIAGQAVAPSHLATELSPTTIPDGLGGAFVGFLAIATPATSHTSTGNYAPFVAHVDQNGTPVADWQTGEIGYLYVDGDWLTRIASPGPGRVWVAPEVVSPPPPAGLPDFVARPIGNIGITLPDSSLTASRT